MNTKRIMHSANLEFITDQYNYNTVLLIVIILQWDILYNID